MLIGAANVASRPPVAFTPVNAGIPDSGIVASHTAAAAAFYYSPKLRFDTEANVLVMEFRDIASGELQRTIPTKSELDAYQKAAKVARAEENERRMREMTGVDLPLRSGTPADAPAVTDAVAAGTGDRAVAAPDVAPRGGDIPAPAVPAPAAPSAPPPAAAELSSAAASFRSLQA